MGSESYGFSLPAINVIHGGLGNPPTMCKIRDDEKRRERVQNIAFFNFRKSAADDPATARDRRDAVQDRDRLFGGQFAGEDAPFRPLH